MGTSKRTLGRINSVRRGWENLRPTKQFSGFTLEKFTGTTRPSLDIREQMAVLESQLRALAAQLVTADAVSEAAVKSVLHGVKGDLEEGDDGELYGAMGFVRSSLRSSGLTRKRASEPAKSGNGAASS
jgi:hypothetical protein